MSLFDCPNEILHEVYSYLESEDVKTLRLTNKVLAELGISHLPHTVTTFMSKWCTTRLTKLSLHPLLRRNVKTVRFYPIMDHRHQYGSGPHLPRKPRIIHGNETAKSILDAMMWESSKEPPLSHKDYMDFLRFLLPGFPNLQSVVISDIAASDFVA
ncbi:hypothetical protein MMC10_004122, partial [Thelotrema lepadinum]|nr:hypothetical protein [Thelotrema lepadinum]